MLLKGTDYRAFLKPEWEETARPLCVALVQPPNFGDVRLLMPHMKNIGCKPPIGLLYLATFLKQNTSHSVNIIDAQAENLELDRCVNKIAAMKPDVVGITAWTHWWYATNELGRRIKARLPGTHICLGGPHLGLYPEETLAMAHVDSVVVGDGEVPFSILCNMLGSTIKDNGFPGLHFKEFGVKNQDLRFYIHKDLDDLPIPDRTLLPLANYTSVLGKSDFITTMSTSRGCPYQCTFCKLNFQKTVCRSADSVVREFDIIQQLGIKEVEIYDETFSWSAERVKDICQGLIRNGNTVKWSVRDRVNMVSDELLGWMKKAGCLRIHFGVESGVDRVVKLMKKRITTMQVRTAVKLAKKHGFMVLTYFMIGSRGESVEDIQTTMHFAIELDADYAQFAITIPYPGTALYEDALKSGRIAHDYWGEFAKNPVPDFCPGATAAEGITEQQLIALQSRAYRRFYLRPKFILRELTSLRRWPEFRRKLSMGLQLLQNIFK